MKSINFIIFSSILCLNSMMQKLSCSAQSNRNLTIQLAVNTTVTKEIDPVLITVEFGNIGDKQLTLPSPCPETNNYVYIGLASNLQIRQANEAIWYDLIPNGLGKEVANEKLTLGPKEIKKFAFYHVLPYAFVKYKYQILPPNNYFLRLRYKPEESISNKGESTFLYSNEVPISITPYEGADKEAYDYLLKNYIWPFVNEPSFRGFDFWESGKPDGKGTISAKISSQAVIDKFPNSNLASWAKLNLAFYYLFTVNEEKNHEMAIKIASELLENTDTLVRYRAEEFIVKCRKSKTH